MRASNPNDIMETSIQCGQATRPNKVGDKVIAKRNAGKLVRQGDTGEIIKVGREWYPGAGQQPFILIKLDGSGYLTQHNPNCGDWLTL